MRTTFFFIQKSIYKQLRSVNNLYFRYITRGLNSKWVADKGAIAYELLNIVLPNNKWVFEVVTDKSMHQFAQETPRRCATPANE